MEIFSCKTKIVAGQGAVKALAELGAKRLLLITDPFFTKSGVAQRVAQAAGAEAVSVFDGVRPDPSVELVARGVAQLREFKPDAVAALGGGSTMDCAKAVALFGGGCPMAAIPTTSGSGSEVTDFAVLTHNDGKYPLIDPAMRPELAILDSDLLDALPPTLVADGGFDVLAHALEACVATGAGPLTDCLAREAFRMAYANLPGSFAGQRTLRLDVHRAATMAGLAFNQAGLGLCHALSHALGGMFHLPHGRLNAILLPAVVGCNAEEAGAAYARLARYTGIGGSADTVAVRNLRNGLIRLRRELGLPETLAQAGVSPEAVRKASAALIAATLADLCCKTNPVAVDAATVTRILREVTGCG